jgi:hypothetical protein
MVKGQIERTCADCGAELGPGYHRPGARCSTHQLTSMLEASSQLRNKSGPAYERWKMGHYYGLQRELRKLEQEMGIEESVLR